MHATIRTDTMEDFGGRQDFGARTPPDLSHKNPPLKWVPVIVENEPPSDPATQKIMRLDVVTIDSLTVTFSAVALTQAEIDARNAEIAAERASILAKLDAEAELPVEDGGEGVRLRALIELFNQRDNFLVQRIVELQNTLAAIKATREVTTQELRGAIPASFLPTQTRSKASAVAEYRSDIASGAQDR